ncbi:MAG: helicase-associated domain-containing protein, partial [Anaerolineae bacterium]
MADEISQILDTYHFNTLASMAEAAGLDTTRPDGKKLRKKQLVATMRAEFFTEKRVRASWERLSERERTALNRLLLRGGSVATKSLRRELIRAELATQAPEREEPKSYYYYSGVPYDRVAYEGTPTSPRSRVFEDVIARLTYHGLVFSQSAAYADGGAPFKIQFHPADTLYVPQVVRQYLPEPDPVASALASWQPERVEGGTPAILLRDLYLYWDYTRKNKVGFIQSGTVAKRHLKTVNEILLAPDPLLKDARSEAETGRLYLLRQLLEACRLARQERGMLRPVGKSALTIPEFWEKPQAEQLAACLEAWPHLQGASGLPREADSYGTRHAYARKALLVALKEQNPGRWIEPDELLEHIQSRDPDFLFDERTRIENYRYGYYSSYAHGYYSESTETLLKQFDQFEVRFINNCLSGFLHEIGAVELGYTGDRLAGFRITPAGAEMLGLQPAEPPAPPPEDAGRLIVQPNFQLMAIGPVSLALLAQLDLFAEREQADRGAFAYRLTRESVYRAQQMGLDVANVQAIIARHADTDLPQNVRRSLDEWAAHHERIVFRTGISLLQAASPELLDGLVESPDTGKHLARAVTPQVALLKKGRREALVSALVAQGLFPAVSSDRPESADHSVIIQEDGAIQPIHAVPSLHLRGRLARLAEEGDGGAWRLTPASVRRAGGNRDKVLELLEELERLHRGHVPPRLVERIKAWGGYYGQAAAETLTLIEFDDQVTLDELQARPDLAPYLTPFPAQG